MKRVITGLEKFIAAQLHKYRNARLGLLANQASVGPDYQHAVDMLDDALPDAVQALFSPQHGWAGEKQDNMVESAHGHDINGRPIFSLYGETRRPTEEMLAAIDVLLIDLFDVGTRVYTFAQTMSYIIEAASKTDIKIIILDRPNPIGGSEVEGNILTDDCRSFVGLHPVPMRHGLTMGEMALFINACLEATVDLEIVKCEYWKRSDYFPQTLLPWVLPSPNMPSFDCAWVYPGQVLWEGTNISEARGTTRPFNLVGAPFIDADILFAKIKLYDLPGVRFRKAAFQPTFHKWAGEMCFGLEIFPVDKSFKPYLTSLCILREILLLWPEHFILKPPPYEYEFDRRPIDLILGDKNIYDQLIAGVKPLDLEQSWKTGLDEYMQQRKKILLYD